MKKKIELEITALSHSITQKHTYAVVLSEVNGMRTLPIVIGGYEAQAIAVALEQMQPARPLTHDLLKNILVALQTEVQEIVIYDLQEGVFFSKIICTNLVNETIEIDSRTSDALALAVRYRCPIFIYEKILKQAGILMDDLQDINITEDASADADYPSSNKDINDEDLSLLTKEQLQQLLDKVLEEEDYIKAIAVRDELNSRK